MAEHETKNLTPFLKTTFKLVEDPNTNELISWKYDDQTFIIPNQVTFSSLLLPKYFKHENFSSFVSQLNNYGFRKVNNNPCEYYNQWFQPGREDLLYNIKRRSEDLKRSKQDDFKRYGLIAKEYEDLKNGCKNLKDEINELRLEQKKNIEKQLGIANLEEGKEEEDIVSLVMKNLSNPSFVRKLIEKLNGDEVEESGKFVTKKPRLSEDNDKLQVSFESNSELGAEKICQEGAKIDDLAKILPNLNSGNCFELEEMLFDDLFIEKDCEGEVAHTDMMLELRDIITKPSILSCDKTSLVEKEVDCKRGVGQ